MATARDCHVLTSYYLSMYDAKYGNKPLVNRNKARWGFDSMLYDMSMDEVKGLINFYLSSKSTHRHSLEWLFNNYDRLAEKKKAFEKDEEDRRKLREESKRRLKELDGNS